MADHPPILYCSDTLAERVEPASEEDEIKDSSPSTPSIEKSASLVFPPPATPETVADAIAPLPETKFERNMRMFSSAAALFLAGWFAGATGALLPYIERAYGLNYSRVSLLFVCNFLGYVAAAAGIGTLSRRIGYGHTLLAAVISELVGNIINSSQQKSFVAMCLSFFIQGMSFATQLGLINAYFALLPKPLVYTGVLHSIFGFGAFASPLVATAMVTRGIPFHFFYAINLGMNVPILGLIWFAFRRLQSLPKNPEDAAFNESHSLRHALKNRSVWTLSLFMMLYVGAEESIGGWIVSYVMEVRHGSPQNASRVSSTFYLGIAVGRLVLPTLNVLIGERLAVFIYLAIALGLEVIAWTVPVYASTATATALVGFAVSTFYTAAIIMGGHLIPRTMHADAFSLMSSIGQSGSALFPLLVGVISSSKGIWIVEPAVVSLLAGAGVMWFLVPKQPRKVD